MKTRKDINNTSIANKRMLNMREAMFYTGMGYTNGRKWLEEIGAIRRFGSRIMADKNAIDAALDSMDNSAKGTNILS